MEFNFKCKSSGFIQMEAASRMNSGTWVLGVTGMHHGFSSSHFKGPMFLFLSSYWCLLAVPTSRQPVASWPPWFDRQHQPESPPLPAGLAFWFRGLPRCREGSWSKHNHQRQQECWVLCGLTRAWVTRDRSVPFLAFHTCMESGPSYRTFIKKQQWRLKSSKSANIFHQF